MFCRTNVALNGFQTLVALERLCHLVTLKTKLKPLQIKHCLFRAIIVEYLTLVSELGCNSK